MSKKLKISLIIGGVALLLFVSWFFFLKDDYKQIENEVYSLSQWRTHIVHIEMIDDDYALAIYVWGKNQHAGVIEFERTLFGWKMTSGISERLFETHQFVELENFSVIHDSVRPNIKEVRVQLRNGDTHSALIREGNDAAEIYMVNPDRWYYYSDTEDLAGATVTTYDKDGQVVEEIQIPDEPSRGAVTQ
ncbi:hypothetical protein HXA34_01775 [Salipaludibacillus agaradhaerens]|jgi:hypothetical protein|uniref:hypothetical protein n=1 Tax=Salipaludibacillus agaradhaerens TaxID=76935 RepID=UPI0021516BCA|nr:hypothetical protein [Salipaludibacillus agaradhaerens]MCR6105013.1 hypothetical protein [Salipaludibacillus agaradhaerens]MCR6117058.1 hypothetical protein [Salipaludibacillus agaradhaerens]